MTLVCSCPSFDRFWWMSHTFRYCLPLIHSWLCSTPLQCLSSQSLNLILLRPSLLCCRRVSPSLPAFLYLPVCSRCPSLAVTLWIFACLLRNGTQGTRALQSILQTARPRRTRFKCHVTTWEDDIWRRRGETAPKYLLLPAVLKLKGGGYDWEEESKREHWWERLETAGERKKFW